MRHVVCIWLLYVNKTPTFCLLLPVFGKLCFFVYLIMTVSRTFFLFYSMQFQLRTFKSGYLSVKLRHRHWVGGGTKKVYRGHLEGVKRLNDLIINYPVPSLAITAIAVNGRLVCRRKCSALNVAKNTFGYNYSAYTDFVLILKIFSIKSM